MLLFATTQSRATHMYGADLFYTHISGNTYKVSLYIYGDCSGNAFPNLPGAPVVRVLNGNALFKTLTLKVEAPTNGLEVTPVCPAEVGNTKCSSLSNTIPGVKRFTYSDTVTLNTTSTNWRFRFTGAMGSSSAGRSNGITNIANNTTMNLEATLNNTSVSNSSPTYTTIPTPFFCINMFVNYNTGAIDANNDSLVYSLVAGLNNSGTVTYNTGYSATSPLAVATGSFSFNNATGQLAFLPNLLQKSLVVIRVNEYRNGVLIGTSMREMTFIIANCTNNPPTGIISNNNRGTVDSIGTKISVCQPIDTLRFSINPTDLDTAHKITMSYKGLPAGATLNISNNTTTAPTSTFTWPTANVATGSYTFFVTYLDDGCPIVSKQTMAYTIDILPEPKAAVTITQEATCTKKAVVSITPRLSPSDWQIQVKQGATVVHTFNNVTGTQIDSLQPGSYTIRTTNADSCFWDTSIVVTPPPIVGIAATVNDVKCFGDTSGMITVTGTGGKGSFTYAINSAGFTSSNTFSGLNANTYILKAKDANDCIKDTSITLTNPTKMTLKASVKNATCVTLNDGQVILSATGGASPYTYAVGNGSFIANTTFSPLNAGSYLFKIKDTNDCIVDTTINIIDSLVITANITLQDALCKDSSSGTIQISAANGTSPYTYAINNGSYSSTNPITKLQVGGYAVSIKDSFGCKLNTNVTINEPNKIDVTLSPTNPKCYNEANGVINITATGGTTPYQYALNNNSYSNNNSYTGLASGSYTVKIKDTNNCTTDTTIQLTPPSALQFSFNLQNVTCFGEQTGAVTVNASGGTPAYSYAFDGNGYQSQSILRGMDAGRHNIILRDSKGCYKDSTIVLTEPPALSISNADLLDATCEGMANGAVTIKAKGGTSPYTYAINNGQFDNNNIKQGLKEGTHIISIKDNNNCRLDSTIALKGYPHILLNDVVSNPVSCYGYDDGSLDIIVNGGTPSFKYQLDAGQYTDNKLFSNLPAGAYTITVEDSLGCKKDTTLLIASPEKLNIETKVTPNDCDGVDNSGMIAAKVTGGTAPYRYSWSYDSLQTADRISGIANGKYIVIVTDFNECTESMQSEIKYDNCCTIFIPDAFTPNNDGRNDYARILNKGEFTLEVFSIYNRFGERVFTTDDINAGWDGIHNGKKQDLGTYFYFAKGLCGNERKSPVLYKGTITLIK